MKRDQLITVRATTAEHEAIRKTAKQWGGSVSELVRALPMLVDFWQDPDNIPEDGDPAGGCRCSDPGCPCSGPKRCGAP